MKGKPTWVFAYLALPEGASVSNRVPGVVLAHGGGCSAYPSWPKIWTKHGYAAIVVDTCTGFSSPIPLRATGNGNLSRTWIASTTAVFNHGFGIRRNAVVV